MALSKYPVEQRDWIKAQWLLGQSSTDISDMMVNKFGVTMSSKAVIGLVFRMKLPARPSDGPWREAGLRRRAGNAIKPKPKPPQKPPEAPTEALPAVGPVEEMVSGDACKWPVSATGEPFQQCGHVQAYGRPYCEFHCRLAYSPSRQPINGTNRAARTIR